MPNLLSTQTSPYLLQHATHPVHWQPWGPAALEQARAQDKPILLSIGYSACHWCHVMARESFEDAATAALMNELFVNIKVDREERPDLDAIYQDAHQLLTRQGGGWPLTVFLAPDGVPFHSGTYYPPEERHGRPAFRDLLTSVATAWRERREGITRQNAAVLQTLAQTVPRSEPSADAARIATMLAALAGPLQEATTRWLAQRHDSANGGFGSEPKLPFPTNLAWLLERGVAQSDAGALNMALHTLRKMAAGGLYDQLGGGFFRYSVDARWEIPHFEKMLYDNGQLLGLYADAVALTGEALFGRVVEDTMAWLLREMVSGRKPEPAPVPPPAGSPAPDPAALPSVMAADHALAPWCASLDADSEGKEGRFYLWTPDQMRAALTPMEWDLAAAHWDLIAPANFEQQHWHLKIARSEEAMAATLKQPQAALTNVFDTARAKLLSKRDERTRPARDDKVLTSWNALMAAGVARAAGVAGRADWLQAAQQALDFIRREMWEGGVDPAGDASRAPRLLAVWKDGRAHLDAYLDDHAFLIEALLASLQAGFRIEDLRFAQTLADELLLHFEDTEHGGFFFTRHDHEALIHRPKTAQDDALPSGNASAAWALQRLGHLVGEPRYLRAAERTLAVFAPHLARNPGASSRLLQAALEQAHPPTVVLLRGPQAAAWRDDLLTHYLPHTLVLALPLADADGAGLPAALLKPLPQPLTEAVGESESPTQAWVCTGTQCQPPLASLQALRVGLGIEGGGPVH